MPSVEMRRSTRVFVPKAKDGELVRVLRSGRRLWVESSAEVKHRGGGKNEDEWFPLLDDSGSKCKQPQQRNGWHDVIPKPADDAEAAAQMDIDEEEDKLVPDSSSFNITRSSDRMFRNVYSRKRKRWAVENNNIGVLVDSHSGEDGKDNNKKFGLHFVRRQKRRTTGQSFDFDDTLKASDRRERSSRRKKNDSLSIVVESFGARCSPFSCLLCSLLRHMTRAKVGLFELSSFLLSTPISSVFVSSGIHFLLNYPFIKRRGVCVIFGARQQMPLFTVDFSAASLCFLHLHATMFFRSVRLSCLCSIDFLSKSESRDIDDPLSYINGQSEGFLSRSMAFDKDDCKYMKSVNLEPGVGKLGSLNVQNSNGVATRNGSKRRRRSLRTRRARNPSLFVAQKVGGRPVSVCLALEQTASLLPLAPNQVFRRSVQKSFPSEISVPKSSVVGLTVDIDSQICSANILVVESDKCYRIEGAEIMLDIFASNEWVLAVKKDGSLKYCLKAQREMRPGTTNRFTHSVVWAGENGWKLEFPERKDWSLFKELYKVCGERNAIPASPVVKFIPVPGVCELTKSWDSTPAPFERPDSYIKMTSDELSRALSSKRAYYDMDSEDEEWLRKLNSVLDAADRVSEETFELMIDAFEKASFCNPKDCNDEKAAASLCQNLACSVVGEAAYRFWMKKRKHKRAPLLTVFQMNQIERAQLITKPVLRKKRSLKRQMTQRGRGKDSSVLQAIAAEQSAVEEQNAMLRVEEAKASANRSMELAIIKRQRAQLLMENADLAMYRATMALRIADEAQVADSQQVAAHFLD